MGLDDRGGTVLLGAIRALTEGMRVEDSPPFRNSLQPLEHLLQMPAVLLQLPRRRNVINARNGVENCVCGP